MKMWKMFRALAGGCVMFGATFAQCPQQIQGRVCPECDECVIDKIIEDVDDAIDGLFDEDE